jgi:inorganic pyrophosphatase
MSNLLKIPSSDNGGCFNVVVETPRGSAAKLKFDGKLKCFTLSKSLLLGLTYPYDWGFIPSTRGPDGDPLDAMVIHDVATYPGLVLRCTIIGVLEAVQKEKGGKKTRNDRFIAVPVESHRDKETNNVDQLPSEVKNELQKFFKATDELERKTIEFLGWKGPRKAASLIEKFIRPAK